MAIELVPYDFARRDPSDEGERVELPPLDDADAPADVLQFERANDNALGADERPYRLYSAGGLDDLPPPTWIVEQAIPSNGFVSIIGPKGSLKTFIALDLALHVATGLPWHDRATMPGHVVYVFAEGPFGAKARVDAWCAYQSRATGLPLNRHELTAWFLPRRLPMNNDVAVAALAGEIAALPAVPTLIVIDTLNQNLDGEEDGKGMIGFVGGCAKLQRMFGATVIAVHHSPLGDEGRARGHTSFDGALDTRLIVSRDADRATLECTHQRNAEDGWSVHYETVKVSESLALKASGPNAGKLSGQRLLLLEKVSQEGTVTYSELQRLAEMKPSGFKNALRWLKANAYVRQDKKLYRATDAGVMALGHRGSVEGHS